MVSLPFKHLSAVKETLGMVNILQSENNNNNVIIVANYSSLLLKISEWTYFKKIYFNLIFLSPS